MRFTVEQMVDFAEFADQCSMNHTRKSLRKVLEVFCHSRNIEFTEEEISSLKEFEDE